MFKFFKNVSTALRSREIAFQYVGWVAKKFATGGVLSRNVHGVNLSGFNGFSEYHSVAGGVSKDELTFIEIFPFGEGAFIDVGSNLGLFALLLNKRFRDRKVIAFEPNPSTFSALKKNVMRNGASQVECHQNAIADCNGSVTFSVREYARANASISNDRRQISGEDIRVPCITLDAFCKNHGISHIALLKVDVEGFESLVFKGAAAVLEHIRPGVIYFEVCPGLTRAAGFDAIGPAQHLMDHGYVLYRLDNGGELQPVDVMAASIVDHVENWVAIDSQ